MPYRKQQLQLGHDDQVTRCMRSVIVSSCHLVIFALLLAACATTPALPQTSLSAVAAAGGSGAVGFAKVTQPRPFVFPADHGPHQEYATEWWYYTGNLDTADGRHVGYQLTFFRFGLAPQAPQRASQWATANLYMAHFALTDVAGTQFHAFDRFSRAGAGLAGASGAPYHVWLDDWSVEGGANGLPMHLRAQQDGIAIDLTLDTRRPVVLQGDRGVSQKSPAPGNASYYYSLTHMASQGTVTLGGQRLAVRGLSWMDREWGTTALDTKSVGWDWFSIQLDDGRDLMYYRIRGTGGQGDYRFGTLVGADGSVRRLAAADVQLDALGTWRSPRNQAEYPSGWRLQIKAEQLDLTLTPYLQDQELPLAVTYWEGANRVAGTAGGAPVRGNAYVELTGYGEQAAQGSVRVR